MSCEDLDEDFKSAIDYEVKIDNQFQINLIFEVVKIKFPDFDISANMIRFGLTMDETTMDIYLIIHKIQISDEFNIIFEE